MATAKHTPVGIDEATLTRDRRGAEQPMGIWPISPGMWKVGTGSNDYSEYTVDLQEGRCTCSDWQYRGEPGSGEINRCKHAARVLMALERIHPPADADVDQTLVAQRKRWSR
ncbi:zinc finger SWIM domain-containing protein [Natronococcus amylolyticus DSM 10524]|uniref:Zinc finger SWIM domain-containing protein n=1 Tax=Natronococcus amylolyticus DSM 10524 TaxID=1227497 RepID=L9X4H8_9EURY|nr:SWIM zinc finger family protein [Natronococcus amylolyticus]ELY56502.1 zinc finger SWIM domain-containing protein [Natronococcus amylolyticus DSM 10524]